MTNREQWMSERSTAIGASEMPCLFRDPATGASVGYTSEYALWAEKSGLIPRSEPDDTEALYWGSKLQRSIAEGLEHFAAIRVRHADEHEFLRHHDYQFIGCTPDAYAYCDERDDEGLAEIKNVGQYLSKDWTEEPPLRVQVQCQGQMAVTGKRWAVAAGLVGGNRLRWYVIERNDRFIADLIKRCKTFWQCVADGTPPDVDGSEATKAAIALLHPDDNGGTVELGEQFIEESEELEALGRVIADAEKRRGEIQNKIRAAIGSNTFCVLPDGSGFSLKTQTRPAHEVKASTFRVLRRTKAKVSK